MKTKHILTALALPAILAACTADDIVNESSMTDLQGRAKLSENFAAKVSEGVDSRYAVEGSTKLYFNFETGDKFAAATIDQYVANTKVEDWPIVSTLPASPIPFTYNATTEEWKAPADMPLGVGHYLFLYPYNRNDVNRAAASYELPAVQKLYTEEDGDIDLNAAIAAGDKSFYSTVLFEGDEEVNISLEHLYAYPKFVINFDNGEKVTTVSKVVLAKKGGFEVKGGFDHKAVAALFANENEAFIDEDTEETDWSLVQTADLLTSNEEYATIETSPYLVAELPLNAKVEEITNNKVFEVRFMIPGVLMEDLDDFDAYTLYIYTNNGVYAIGEGEDNSFEEAISWKKTTKTAAKLKAFARGTSNTITFSKDEIYKAEDEKYIVTNIADWNDLVELYGDEDKFTEEEEGAIEIVVVGDALVLDETAEMPSEAQFKVTSLKVEGEVELCNVIAEKVVVAEDATLTTCAEFKATEIINEGSLVVAPVYNKKEKAVEYEGIASVINYGTIDVEEDAITGFHLTNHKGAVLNNEGDLYIYNEYWAMTIEGEVDYYGNEGTINNDGTIDMGNFVNVAPEYKGIKLINMPTINNDGKILTKGTVLNFGTVINEGTLSCKNQKGTFENNGILDAKEDGLTYITENNGNVIVYAPFQEDVVIEENLGKVSYKTTKASESFLNETTGEVSYVNNLYVSDDYTVATGYIKTLNVEGDATISLAKSATTKKWSSVGNLNVWEGTAVLGTDFSFTSVYVAEDAMIKVPVGKSMTVTSSNFENEGEIEVAGIFSAKSVSGESAKAGLVTESGANAEIYWKENADEESNYNAYINAMAVVATDMMNKSSRYTDDYDLSVEDVTGYYEYCIGANPEEASEAQIENAEAMEAAMEAADIEEITAVDLKKAMDKVAEDNKEDLIEALETATIVSDATLYAPTLNADGTVKISAKTNAYNAFQVKVKKGNITASLDKAVNYAAVALTDSEIDAILAEAAPFAYIWEGCELDQLVTIWTEYKGLTASKNDYSLVTNKENASLETMVNFFLDVKKKGSSVAIEIAELIEDWTILELKGMKYTDPQVVACTRLNATGTLATAGGF